jgi:cytochrome c553
MRSDSLQRVVRMRILRRPHEMERIMMLKIAVTATLLFAAIPASAQAAKASQCFECHGEGGIAVSSGYPNLAGQHPDYLAKQLRDFRGGQRSSPFMNIVAARLKEEDLADISAYFSAQPKAKSANANAHAAGRALYVRSGGSGSCASCHGDQAEGSGQVPALRGQQMFYLREQLLNWRAGQRNNSPGKIMNQVADTLSDSEIDTLARYLADM